MPARRHDDQAKWFYPVRYPGMDMRRDDNAVDPRLLVDSVGVDGRFEGSVRTFPGFADESVHGIPAPEAGVTTIESIENIVLIKYVSIRRGTSPDSLRGLVILADNPAGDGKALYFAYRDSSDGSSDVVLLEDFRSWSDIYPTTFDDFGISHLGRYAYFVNSGDLTVAATSWDGQEGPYNKAYFWDFKINTWDRYEGGFQGRFLGLLPERTLRVPVNSDKGGVLATQVYDTQIAGDHGVSLPRGEYTLAVELISQKHRLRSFLRLRTENQTFSNSTLEWFTAAHKLPESTGGTNRQLHGDANITVTAPLNWGLSHVDGVRLWRTPRNDSGVESGKYESSQRLYKVREYEPFNHDVPGTTTDTESWYIADEDDHSSNNARDIAHISDDGLVTREEYSPSYHSFGPAPRMKRVLGFDGLLIGVTDPREPESPDEQWRPEDRLPESFVWSAIHLNEPENFPTLNYEELDDPNERILSLHAGASSAFAVSNMGIYRIVRSGTSLSITRVAYPVGGLNRYSAVAVGDTLYVVTKTGIREVDGLSGEIRTVRNLNRLVTDDKRWADSLDSVKVGYDSFAGCLVFLNTDLEELVLLWESTGAVTRVIDAPWTHLATGPDAKSDSGGNRAYLVDNAGSVHSIDAFRESGKVTMFGAGATDTVNGTVTSTSSSQIIDSTASFPASAVGVRVYILSGDRKGESAKVSARPDSNTLTLDSSLSGSLAVGDRYAVGPVVVHLRLPRLTGVGRDDPFIRKLTSSMSASLQDLKGEVNSSDPNAKVTLGLHSGSQKLSEEESTISTVPDKVVTRANVGGTKLFPYLESYGANMDYEVDAVLVHGHLSISEAESRQG